jgi:tRNA pseudouridine55 synthase
MVEKAHSDIVARFTSREGGIMLVDKPQGWTSFDVVNKLRRVFGVKKLGHAGTLDPLATGLLILCSNGMTKAISGFQDLDKKYSGVFEIGKSTPSHDADTAPDAAYEWEHITQADITGQALKLTGKINQIPPMYSALKKGGARLYALARKGIEVERTPREVTVHEFSISEYNPPFARFMISCTKGTYIRSLVHEVGVALKAGAYVTELRREAIGGYSVGDARTVGEWIDTANEMLLCKEHAA